MLDQPSQSLHEPTRQSRYRLPTVHVPAVPPHHRKPALAHAPAHFEQMRAPPGRTLEGPYRFAGQHQRHSFGSGGRSIRGELIELPEIVEDHFRRSLRDPGIRLCLTLQIAKQAVADSSSRNPPQLLFHRLQRLARTPIPGNRQPHRMPQQGGQGFPGYAYSRFVLVEPGYMAPTDYFKVIPDMGESWEYSPDGLTLTMKLPPSPSLPTTSSLATAQRKPFPGLFSPLPLIWVG